MYRNWKNTLFLACCLVLGLIGGSCGAERQSSLPAEGAPPSQPLEIRLPTLSEIAAEDIHRLTKVAQASVIRCTGTIHAPPQSQATVSVPMGGFVKHIIPIEGQYVKKGHIIAVLEHPDYLHLQEQYLDAISDLAFLEKENTRQQLLAEANAGTGREKEKTESELQSTKVKVAALAKELQWLRINPNKLSAENLQTIIKIPAPVSGYVWNIHANPGKYLDRNESILEMTDIDHLHLELQVYEQDASKLREGQMIDFQLGADGSEQSYKAEVYLIGQLVDTESRTLRVHGHLESDEREFKPGTFVEAEIQSTVDSAVFVPRAGIRGEDSDRFVYLVSDAGLQKQVIELSKMDQVGAYLASGERLVGASIWLGEEAAEAGD